MLVARLHLWQVLLKIPQFILFHRIWALVFQTNINLVGNLDLEIGMLFLPESLEYLVAEESKKDPVASKRNKLTIFLRH